MYKHHEGISLAWHVLFSFQELGYQLRGIRDQEIKISEIQVTNKSKNSKMDQTLLKKKIDL